MEQQHTSGTRRGDPGSGRDRFERGYCVLSKRTWERIRVEFSGGASVAWLSARYGAAERTIAQHARKGGWRRKDLALKADAVRDAEDAAVAARTVEAVGRDVPGGAGSEAGVQAPGAEPDLMAAARQARTSAVAVMETHPRLAQDYLKLARMLEGADEEGEAETLSAPTGRTPQHEAALAVIRERLGIEG